MPIFSGSEPVEIDFDNVRGYRSSILEEAFGGLLRNGVPLSKIRTQIKFKSSKDSIIMEINRYMEDQANKKMSI